MEEITLTLAGYYDVMCAKEYSTALMPFRPHSKRSAFIITSVIQIDDDISRWQPDVPVRLTRSFFSVGQCLERSIMMFNEFSGIGSSSLSFGMPLIHALGLIFGIECKRTVEILQPQLGMEG